VESTLRASSPNLVRQLEQSQTVLVAGETMKQDPARSPLHPDAVAMLVCLGVQLSVVVYVTLFISLVPDWFMGLQNLIMIVTTAAGAGCAVGSVRQRGWINRGVGIAGVIWFGFLITLAVVAVLNRV
jgi:hypothetical protein